MSIENKKPEEGKVKVIVNRDKKKSKLINIKAITFFLVVALLSLSYVYLDPSITGFSELDLGSLFDGNESNETTITNSTNITESTNASEAEFSIQPVYIEQNISNFTKENVTEVLITENRSNESVIQIPVNVSKEKSDRTFFEWNFSKLPKEKTYQITNNEVYFDGKKDYAVIEGSESANFSDRSLRIEILTKINQDSKGVIVSRFDYPNVTHIEVGVDVTGSIKFDIGDVGFSTILETEKTYNDGNYHSISAVINNNKAELYVDNVFEVEADITELVNINNYSPISVGANIGYLSYMQQPVDNYNGVVKEVRIIINKRVKDEV